MTRTLTLRRDVLTDLTTGELRDVIGGTTTGPTTTIRACEPETIGISCQICPPTLEQSCTC